MINVNKWAKTCNSLRELLNLLSCSKCKKSLHEPRQFLDCGHVSCISCTNNSNNTCVDCLLNSKNQNLQKDETIHKIVQACCTIANIVGLKNNEDIGMKLEQAPLSHNGNIAISNPKLDNNILTIHSKLTKKSCKKIAKRKKDINASSNQAIKKPKLDKFRAILCNPKKINKRSPKGETILLQECLKNHVDNVKAFLDVGADPNIPCFAGWTPLQESVAYNFHEIAEVLLKFNADVNKKGHEGRTALHEAAKNNNLGIIQLLLNYGAKKDIFDNTGNLPIFYCQLEEAKVLLCIDTQMEVQNNCTNDNLTEKRILTEDFDKGPSTSERTTESNLNLLPTNKEEDMYLELDIKEEDNVFGELDLMFEKINSMNISFEPLLEDTSHQILAKYTDEKDADTRVYENCVYPRRFDKQTKTTVKCSGNDTCHKYNDSNPAENSQNSNILNHAKKDFSPNTEKKRNPEKFKSILSNPYKINKRSPKGETILLQECRKNHVDTVRAFLNAGADPNIPCHAHWTPLQECVDYNFYELSEILLKFNADVNKKGHEGRTALHEAARNNNSNFIQLLLSYGAKKNVFDDAGNLPVSYCQSEETKALLHVDKDENSPENRNLFEISNEFPSISESTSQIIVSPLNNNNSLTEDKSIIATNTNESPSTLKRTTRNSLLCISNKDDEINNSKKNESIFAESSNKTPSTFKSITRSSPLSMCSTEKDESTNSKRHENIIEEYSGETLSIIKETTQSSFIPTNEKEDKLYLNPSIEEEENSSQELDIVFEKVNNIDPKKNLNTSSSVFCSDDSQESIIVISSQKSRALYDKKNVTNSLRNTENNTISLDSEEIIDIEN